MYSWYTRGRASLLKSVEYAYCAIDRIERLLNGLEIAGEYASQPPVQVGWEAKTFVHLPVGADTNAKLEAAHVVVEVVSRRGQDTLIY